MGLTNGAGIGGYSRVPLVSTANRNATFAGAAAFLLILAGMSILLLWESEDIQCNNCRWRKWMTGLE